MRYGKITTTPHRYSSPTRAETGRLGRPWNGTVLGICAIAVLSLLHTSCGQTEHISAEHISTTTQHMEEAVDNTGCHALGVHFNNLITDPTGTVGDETLNVDADYVSNAKSTGIDNVRIDVDLTPWQSGLAIDGGWQTMYRDMIAEMRAMNRPLDVTLAIGNNALESTADPSADMLNNGFCTSCNEENWKAAYIQRFKEIVALFVCETARPEPDGTLDVPIVLPYLEIFPGPESSLHRDWFSEILLDIKDLKDEASAGTATFAAVGVTCDDADGNGVAEPADDTFIQEKWELAWTSLLLVSGSVEGVPGGYLDQVLTYLVNTETTFPTTLVGLDFRFQSGSAVNSIADINTNLGDTTSGIEQMLLQSTLFSSVTSTLIALYGRDANQDGPTIREALTGDADGDGTKEGNYDGFKFDDRIRVAYLHSLRDEAIGGTGAGIYETADGTTYNPKTAVLDTVTGQVCKTESDFVFVIDTTGSMWDEIEFTKDRAEELTNTIFDDPNLDARVALVQYKDFAQSPFGGPTDFPCKTEVDFQVAADRQMVIDGINSLVASGGADWPESVYSALMSVIEPVTHQGILADPPETPGIAAPGSATCNQIGAWRTTANRSILLMGDAPPHDEDVDNNGVEDGEPFTNYTLQQVVNVANVVDPDNPLDCDGEHEPNFCPCPNPGDPLNPNDPDDPDLCPVPQPLPPPESAIAAFQENAEIDSSVTFFTVEVSQCDGIDCNPVLPQFQDLANGTGGQAYLGTQDSPQFVDDLLDIIDDAIVAANEPPVTEDALPSKGILWPANRDMIDLSVVQVFDPENDNVVITITSITQDEPITGPTNDPYVDAEIIGSNQFTLRAERDRTSNGRMYRVSFVATDIRGNETPGFVEVCVPRLAFRYAGCIDDGQLYDSTQPSGS